MRAIGCRIKNVAMGRCSIVTVHSIREFGRWIRCTDKASSYHPMAIHTLAHSYMV